MKSIISMGELLIDIIPGATIRLGEVCYTPHPGGAPANVAVAIARLGGSSRFLGAVSDDTFGTLLLQTLVDNNVDIQHVCISKGAPTAVALVQLHADGQRFFTFFRQETADMQLRDEDLPRNAWQDVAICHTGGVLLASEPTRAATFAAMQYTHQASSLVSFDVNARPALWASPTALRDTMVQAVRQTDILKLSAEEVFFVSGQQPPSPDSFEKNWLYQQGKALLAQGPALVMITLGAHGALLLTSKDQVEVPEISVRSVDTTGAGDAFMGAVLYQLVQQGCTTPTDLGALSANDLRQLGSFANQVAGLSCTRYGGMSSFPSLQEVNSFVATQNKSQT